MNQEECAERAPGVVAWLDEFTRLRRCETIENGMATIASAGVNLVLCVQELGTLKREYGEAWEIFTSGCPVKIFMDVEDEFTASWVVKRAGEAEKRRFDYSGTRSENEGETETEGYSAVDTDTKGWAQADNDAVTQGEGYGRGGGYGEGCSHGKGDSYEGSLLNPLKPKFLRDKWNSSSNVARQANVQKNWQKSSNRSRTRGRTATTSGGQSQARGRNGSSSRQRGESRSLTVSERCEKGTLLTHQEIGDVFARIDHPGDPRYPGLHLIFIRGYPPIVGRRSPYFRDPLFFNKFGPDGDHEFRHAPRPAWLIARERKLRGLLVDRARVRLGQLEERRLNERLQSLRLQLALPADQAARLVRSDSRLRDRLAGARRRQEPLRCEAGTVLVRSDLVKSVLAAPIAGVPVGPPRWGEWEGERALIYEFRPDPGAMRGQLKAYRSGPTDDLGQLLDRVVESLEHQAVLRNETLINDLDALARPLAKFKNDLAWAAVPLATGLAGLVVVFCDCGVTAFLPRLIVFGLGVGSYCRLRRLYRDWRELQKRVHELKSQWCEGVAPWCAVNRLVDGFTR
jgi:hypothetical protein